MSDSEIDIGESSSNTRIGDEFVVFLDENGSFPKSYDKQYTVHAGDNLTLMLRSNLLRQATPILLTNFPTPCPLKNCATHPPAPIIDAESSTVITKTELNKKYKIFHGQFNAEGSWQVDLNIGDFDGSLYLQLIFVGFQDQQQSSESLSIVSYGSPEWLTIQPRLFINGKPIGMDQLIIQTVLPYSLGDSSTWIDTLSTQTQLGYNAFHFPPIQRLGGSGSYYAIRDHLDVNNDLFKKDSSSKVSADQPFAQMKTIVDKLEKEHNALSFVDILLNHTSYDSDWLDSEAVYNPQNTPQLACALELDQAIQNFSDKLADGKVTEYFNGSNLIENDAQLDALLDIMKKEIFYGLELEQYFFFNVPATLEAYKQALKAASLPILAKESEVDDDENIFSKSGSTGFNEFIAKNTLLIGSIRKGLKLDFQQLIKQVISKQPTLYSLESFEKALLEHNQTWAGKVKEYIEQAINSTRGQIKYWHIELNRHAVTRSDSLVPRYFTKLQNGVFAANNGWIMNHDPLKNFADDMDFHYLRRTICIWGDLVKLRYGSKKSDSPALWKRMKKYVQSMARVFHGFRLDNAHSTPLIVGEYFIRKARNVNKSLMIFAELFTGSGDIDAIFCKRIGINALVRELNHNRTPNDIYNNLHWLSRAQEVSVGALKHLPFIDIASNSHKKILTPHQTKSVVYDQTHDNEATLSIYSHRHIVPMIALSAFSHIIQGTVRGFDELYPEKLSVVSERRKYKTELDCTLTELENTPVEVGIKFTLSYQPNNIELKGSWDNWANGIKMTFFAGDSGKYTYFAQLQVPKTEKRYDYKFLADGQWLTDYSKPTKGENNFFEISTGADKQIYFNNMCLVRKAFIGINKILNQQYPFIFFSQYDSGFISVMRENPEKDSFYFLITRTALGNDTDSKVNLEIECPGIISSIEGIYWVSDSIDVEARDKSAASDSSVLSGLKTKVYQEFNILKYAEIKYRESSKKHVLSFFKAPPSLTIVLKCVLHSSQKQGIERLNYMLSHIQDEEILALYKPLNVSDINFLFFSSENEEHERSGYGMYNIPNKGNLLFGGFGGVFADVNEASLHNDLGKPIFENLRQGYWYLDYAVGRLQKISGNLDVISEYIGSYFELLKSIPKYLIPHYFSQFIVNLQLHAQKIIYGRLKPQAKKLTSDFHKRLLLASYQFLANLPSNKFDEYKISMAAGLPHFTVSWQRSWGRDTFISFRGGLLIPGLYEEAKSILCMFGSTLRHGLIPNLLDNGHNPRYNCRDGCWWFVKAVRDYIEFTGDSGILKKEIKMRFYSDDYLENLEKTRENQPQRVMVLQDIVYEIFSQHAKGIKFREWRAGWEIDSNMDTEGFNIQLKLDEQTGFILGGNMKNCLTWMDKMGSSMKAGNKGVPGTCRDGAPIEMTAILKACVDFANKCPQFPYKEVTTSSGKKLSFQAWGDLIQANFEKNYWAHETLPGEEQSEWQANHVTRSGIYKDLYGSSHHRCDYQLRSNAQIAIALAPELFDPQHALKHLQTVEKVLIEKNSIGFKTLDPLAPEYIPFYNNSDDGIQPKTAHGFSYHNGPEWVWGYGYFLKALLEVSKDKPIYPKERLMSYLANHARFITNSEWLSIPEMTNQNGEFCPFSCTSQAWSIATIIEVCYDSIDKEFSKI